ncbi:LLM class F420-dependent oxidoreductase [Actinocrispum wychmicini]|uniref:F420-dependent oxidoreductase-like protein n=1 Tax=Actinocrispum wychmicini TaxID=1213861 RepID=A0A4R2J7Z5_9PSEU|nr:LLM class F420-dependent oxidoreductase [Actinocrispum wychmicini]TCO52598.1 F420-dependent oxidoreductase-like protein [Actinocrispum wychmicini]
MRLGVHVTKFDNPAGSKAIGPELAAMAEAAETAGVSWLSVMDHYFQIEHNGGAEDAMMEAYTTLSFLAAHTSSVRLGALVTGVSYRYPALLAKIVTTLDVLSGGRATLGIGAAWYEREHVGLGVPFPPIAERFERLEETLRVCLRMWDPTDNGPFEGKYYRLAETITSPPPVSSPRPRILIGGGGERKTLRLVAQYADACNLFATGDVAHKLDVLRKHCDEVGRDYAEITKTAVIMRGQPSGDLDDFVKHCEPLAKLGFDEVHVMPPTGTPAKWITDVVAPAVPRIAEL